MNTAQHPPLLGCIADDFTGGTDLANNLVRAGMRVVQTIGVPRGPVDGVDAVVVALKSRTAPVADAVAQSVAAARWLRAQGATQAEIAAVLTAEGFKPRGRLWHVTSVARALGRAAGSAHGQG